MSLCGYIARACSEAQSQSAPVPSAGRYLFGRRLRGTAQPSVASIGVQITCCKIPKLSSITSQIEMRLPHRLQAVLGKVLSFSTTITSLSLPINIRDLRTVIGAL